jgi:alpha-galactosidase
VIDFFGKLNTRENPGFPAVSNARKGENQFLFSQLNLRCRFKGQALDYELPGVFPAHLSLEAESIPRTDGSLTFSVDFTPCLDNKDLMLDSFSLALIPAFPQDTRMMVNGYQSWSRSEEMGQGDRLAPLTYPVRKLLAPFGDHGLFKYSGKKGCFHSWSYTYFRLNNSKVVFFGSLDEKSGFTIFEYDFKSGCLFIRKDCEGAVIDKQFRLLNLYLGTGALEQLLSAYSEMFKPCRQAAPKVSGWCSWYNFYTKVSEQDIITNLSSLEKQKISLDYFQVDDGWQQAIGDWLNCNHKFPSGMKAVADQIKKGGLRPGIWLAPLICVPSSDLFKNHPDWLLCDRRGKPIRAGFNPGWEGFFYALDFDAPGVQDYLDRVFEKVQENWGYRMLKLDFLYAAALLPHNGKTRGEIMAEVVDFIEARTKKCTVLGCGVPLASVFGKFDYCRIGSDVGPYWDGYLSYLNYRERVSTENSLVCTIGRHNLDKLFFRNDPDVFVLRDGRHGLNYNQLNNNQRYTLFLLNNLLGGLIFFSDDVSELTADQLKILRSAYPLAEVKMKDFNSSCDLYTFRFSIGERSYQIFANLSGERKQVRVTGGYYFNPDYFLIQPGTILYLEAYESKCLYQVNFCEHDYFLLGATGHLFPGVQIELLKTDIAKETVNILLSSDADPSSSVYLGLPAVAGSIRVNDANKLLMEKDGIRYAVVDFCREGADLS